MSIHNIQILPDYTLQICNQHALAIVVTIVASGQTLKGCVLRTAESFLYLKLCTPANFITDMQKSKTGPYRFLNQIENIKVSPTSLVQFFKYT